MKLNKSQKYLINRTQKIYDNLKTENEKEKHKKNVSIKLFKIVRYILPKMLY